MSEKPIADALLSRARATRDDLAARLFLAAAVQRVAEDVGIRSVVTGGTAVDFYVAGAAGTSANWPEKWRASRDVDLVALAAPGAAAREILLRALEAALGLRAERLGRRADGSEALGRHVTVPDWPYGLEIVGDELRGDPRGERIFTVEIEGQDVHLRSPEDLIVSYAESGWDTWHGRDWERALAIYRAMKPELDVEHLRARAAERRIPGVLAEVEAQRPLPERRRGLF